MVSVVMIRSKPEPPERPPLSLESPPAPSPSAAAAAERESSSGASSAQSPLMKRASPRSADSHSPLRRSIGIVIQRSTDAL